MSGRIPAPFSGSRRRRLDRPVRCGDLAAEQLERVEVDLREGRERLDRVEQHVERDAGADRERRLLQPLARLRAERVGAGQRLAVAEQRQEAVALGVGARVRLGLRDLGSAAPVALNARLGRADRRGLRVGEDDARHRVVVRLARLAEDVRGDDLALVLADVGELPDAGDVADRPQPLGRAQVRVDRDAVRVGLDADRLQADPLDARTPPGGDEQPVAAQLAAVVERRARSPRRRAARPSPARRARARRRRGAAPRRAPRRAAPARARARARRSRRARPRRRGGGRPAPSRRRRRRRRARAAGAARPSCRSPRGSSRRRRARAGRAPAARTARRRWRARRARPCSARRRPRPRRSPASRPLPRSRAMPSSASQRSWPASE